VGVIADALYGVGVGLHYGVNLQLWLDRNNLPVAGLYWFESLTPAARDTSDHSPRGLGRFKKLAVGIGIAGGLAGDVAWYFNPWKQREDFDQLSPDEITKTWLGEVESWTLASPAVTGSVFRGETYIGAVLGLPGAAIFDDVSRFRQVGPPLAAAGIAGKVRLWIRALAAAPIRRDIERALESFAAFVESRRYALGPHR